MHTLALRRFRHLLNPKFAIAAFCLCVSSLLRAADFPALLDNFSNAQANSLSAPRLVITDKDIGGHSQATQTCTGGVLSLQGDLDPARGQPAFISLVSLLSPDGAGRDLSQYEGVRMKIKIIKGALAVQVASTDIKNYDYHTSAPLARHPDQFTEIKVPFSSLKRSWSEQVALNMKAITSINLVAVGMAKGTFAYEISEIGFY